MCKPQSTKINSRGLENNLNWTEEVLVLEKAKDTLSWKYVIEELNGEKYELFVEQNIKKHINLSLELSVKESIIF